MLKCLLNILAYAIGKLLKVQNSVAAYGLHVKRITAVFLARKREVGTIVEEGIAAFASRATNTFLKEEMAVFVLAHDAGGATAGADGFGVLEYHIDGGVGECLLLHNDC